MEAKFAEQSPANIAAHPASVLVSSDDAGWTSMYVAALREPAAVDAFEPLVTPDQRLSFLESGSCDVESFGRDDFRHAHYRPGDGVLTAPWRARRLRWRSRDSNTLDMLHLFVPMTYFEEAAEEYRRPGTSAHRIEYDRLGFTDPVAFTVARALVRGIAFGYTDLYADGAARFLAAHFVGASNDPNENVASRGLGGDLTDRRLSRVLEYVGSRYADALTLDELAKVANISRFHFTRLFKKKVGYTPHHYIVRTRMRAATSMLRSTDLTVTQVALACGYSNASHFAALFHEYLGATPAAYRSSNRD